MTDEMLPSMGPHAMGMAPIDLSRDIVMGHEFCAEVVELGPDTSGPGPAHGWCRFRCCSLPPGCTSWRTTTTTPAATPSTWCCPRRSPSRSPTVSTPGTPRSPSRWRSGIHAVARSGATARDGAVVVGCGPVGLAVIAALRAVGVESIVAADLSPTRRAMARTMGAVEAVDPAEEGRRRRLAPPRRAPPPRRLRGGRGAGHDPAAAARPAPGHPRRGGRGVHGARPDPPLLRHRQGAVAALRHGLRRPTSSPAPCAPWPKATSTRPR